MRIDCTQILFIPIPHINRFVQTDHDKLWIYCQEGNYAGTRSIIHLGNRAAGAAAGDRAVPEFPAAVLPVLGLETILRRTFGSLRTKSGKGGTSLTQFQTFSTALAAAMGTGNILGVAAALCLGGAGAIFWMWVSALLGMALTYSENVLALRYARTLPDGTKAGGLWRISGSGCTACLAVFTVFAASVLRWAWAT